MCSLKLFEHTYGCARALISVADCCPLWVMQLGPAIVPHRCKEMGAELRELSQLAAPAPGSEPSGPRDFTFEDKRRLSQQLGSLPGEVCTVALHVAKVWLRICVCQP